MLIVFWFFRCVGFRFRCQNNTEKSAVALYILVFKSVYKGEKIGCGHAVSTKTGGGREFKAKKTNPLG